MPTANPEAKAGEVLSQSEVERLLQQIQAEETSATVVKPGGERAAVKSEEVQPCDFRQPVFLTGAELRRIRLRHEEFIRVLAAHLSNYLRLEVAIQMSKLQTISFQKYAESLPSPTHLTLFKVEPLKGVSLLDMAPRLGLTMVDRLLGGPAHSVSFNGELSEIEIALLDQISLIILNEWCRLWQSGQEVHPVLLGHENNGRFLDTSPHDSVMLVLSMETRLGDCVEQMQLAFPFLAIEQLLRQPGIKAELASGSSPAKPAPARWNPNFDEVQLRIKAEWQGLELSARELAGLECGSVLLLENGCFDQVEVLLEKMPKFIGRLGAIDNCRAIELTEIIKS